MWTWMLMSMSRVRMSGVTTNRVRIDLSEAMLGDDEHGEAEKGDVE